MTDTDWLAVATFTAAVLGFLAAILGTRRERKAIRDLHEKVGNGFAEEVISSLGEIASTLDVLKVQVGVVRRRMDAHIKQHGSYPVTARKRP